MKTPPSDIISFFKKSLEEYEECLSENRDIRPEIKTVHTYFNVCFKNHGISLLDEDYYSDVERYSGAVLCMLANS